MTLLSLFGIGAAVGATVAVGKKVIKKVTKKKQNENEVPRERRTFLVFLKDLVLEILFSAMNAVVGGLILFCGAMIFLWWFWLLAWLLGKMALAAVIYNYVVMICVLFMGAALVYDTIDNVW